MADEYDDLNDLWYPHVFSLIGDVLTRYLGLKGRTEAKPVALDVGCGTGIQSLTLARLGYKVVGVDLADRLLERAQAKLITAGYTDATFYRGDATSLPLHDRSAALISCCGSTLSFISDWDRALEEMGRCLMPGGRLLLEVEGRWNLDLFWAFLNAIGFNVLHYDEALSDSVRHLLPPWRTGYVMVYPFPTSGGGTVKLPIRLFTSRELQRALATHGFVRERQWGLHSITNLIPSTILHSPRPAPIARRVFAPLASIERRFNGAWPINRLGCSLLIIARLSEHPSTLGG